MSDLEIEEISRKFNSIRTAGIDDDNDELRGGNPRHDMWSYFGSLL